MQDRNGSVMGSQETSPDPSVKYNPDQDYKAMRSMTSVELQQVEVKMAEQMRQIMNAYLYFPTVQNFQLIQTAAGEYMTAWMNGRKRVLSDN